MRLPTCISYSPAAPDGSYGNSIEIPINAQTANQSLATKLQCSGFHCAGAPETFSFLDPSRQRPVNVAFCQHTDIDSHRTIAEIALWIARTGWRTPNCWMTRQIDRVGYKRSGRIGRCRRTSENCHSVRYSKRKTAATPP